MKKILVIGCPGSGKSTVCPAAAGQDRAAALSSRSSLAQAGQNDRFRSGIRRGARRNTPKRPLDHRRQLQPDAGTATGGMRHGISFRSAACGLHCGRGSTHRYEARRYAVDRDGVRPGIPRVYHAFFRDPASQHLCAAGKAQG